jgi:NAD(P)-dependent dehydrogenase (short-subunit alcohol dehydrogenase family)
VFRLDGKSALVTGSTGHLGREIALSLARAGAHVYVNSRNITDCEELALLIVNDGGAATVACFDVTNQDQVKLFSSSVDLVDIVVNNSYAGNGGTVETSDSVDYISSYQSTVVSSANLVRVLLPHLRKAVAKNGYASVINISSMYGVVAPDNRIYDSSQETNPPFYGAAKAALIQWSKYAACEFAKENIRVNVISPGPFPSDSVQRNSPHLIEKIIFKVPMNRIGNPNDLVGAVVFLASPASSFITGANLPVDGGWTAW